jgi:hypothetical protein
MAYRSRWKNNGPVLRSTLLHTDKFGSLETKARLHSFVSCYLPVMKLEETVSFFVLLTVHHSITAKWNQRDALFIQFIENEGSLHVSSTTCSSSGGAKQTALGKASPLQALTGYEGSRRLSIPDFKTVGTWRWQGCLPYAPAAFNPSKYPWYSFLLEAESTPWP